MQKYTILYKSDDDNQLEQIVSVAIRWLVYIIKNVLKKDAQFSERLK